MTTPRFLLTFPYETGGLGWITQGGKGKEQPWNFECLLEFLWSPRICGEGLLIECAWIFRTRQIDGINKEMARFKYMREIRRYFPRLVEAFPHIDYITIMTWIPELLACPWHVTHTLDTQYSRRVRKWWHHRDAHEISKMLNHNYGNTGCIHTDTSPSEVFRGSRYTSTECALRICQAYSILRTQGCNNQLRRTKGAIKLSYGSDLQEKTEGALSSFQCNFSSPFPRLH